MLKLMETQIPQIYSAELFNERGIDIAMEHTKLIGDVAFNAVTNCLADVKTKENPVSFVFEENNQEFIAAAVIQFIENDDDSNPGNWNYFWTFNKDDVPENSRKITAADVSLASYFRSISQSKYGVGFTDTECIFETTRFFFKVVSKWLDDNASETEERGVELEGVFIARVAVEDGEKVKSIEPDGEIKKMIKDDAAIEV